MSEAILILGNQLFPPGKIPVTSDVAVFMAEDRELCTRFKYHKHKLILFLAAMREYADELSKRGFSVHYSALDSSDGNKSYRERLKHFLAERKISRLHCFEIEDKFFEKRIRSLGNSSKLELVEHPSPMFLKSRVEFQEYLSASSRPFMKTFYEDFRKTSGFLMDKKGRPEGGKFSFDTENRKKLPTSIVVPAIPAGSSNPHRERVQSLVQKMFPDHPGEAAEFWLPVNRREALHWLRDFLENRFSSFGDYEDAITSEHPFVFHSVLSPLLNLGLITPDEVVERALEYFHENDIPLNSAEGFIRQVIGWREFIRGIYQSFSEKQDQENFFGHTRKLKVCWYRAETGLPPVDDAIRKALRYGYNHHIERLMILSNVMLLSEIDPREVHGWFMEMYVDSSDWVMGPNVYGMGQFSDGGVFATKPYICGSNYIRKMSSYPKGEWCDVLDGLYWRFIAKHIKFFRSNPRLATMVGNLERMNPERKDQIFSAAEQFLDHTTK